MALGPVAGPASAQVSQDPRAGQTIMVPKDKSAAFRLDYPASEIVVAAPDTLSLVATTDRSFYVRGKQLGVTNILIYDAQHRLAQVVDVRVGYDVDSLQGDLDTQIEPQNADRLAQSGRARKNATAVDLDKLPGVNHLLVPAKTGDVSEYAALPDRHVSAAVTDAILTWLQKTTPSSAR